MKVTHGAALYDPETRSALMFGDDVPKEWTEKWKAGGRKQLICQAEFFPVLVAKATWKDLISERAVLWFIDNNSSLSTIIRSYSPILDNFEMLMINAQLDLQLQALRWYSRVPSVSNLGDEPSRLKFEEMENNGFLRCDPCYKLTSR